MYYFAYGVNLNQKQMKDRCPDSKPLFTAVLPNYKLVFVGWS
ncbi:MAG: gamma-glutamylcyclotransferase, partial [Dehalococcoidia bacterium]